MTPALVDYPPPADSLVEAGLHRLIPDRGALGDSTLSTALSSPRTAASLPRAPLWSKPWFERILSFRFLDAGWDSYGADPIAPLAIRQAQEVLLTLCQMGIRPHAIVATRVGGVQFEWEQALEYLEIDIGPEGHIEYFSESSNPSLNLEGVTTCALRQADTPLRRFRE